MLNQCGTRASASKGTLNNEETQTWVQPKPFVSVLFYSCEVISNQLSGAASTLRTVKMVPIGFLFGPRCSGLDHPAIPGCGTAGTHRHLRGWWVKCRGHISPTRVD